MLRDVEQTTPPLRGFPSLLRRGMVSSRSARVFEFGVKGPPALSGEIHDIPDRSQFVDSAFLDIGSQPWMPGIRVTDRTVAVASKSGYCRILVSFSVFAA